LGTSAYHFLTHAFACPVTGRSYIKVGMAKGYVGLFCLSSAWSSTIHRSSVLTQAMSGLLVAQPSNTLSAAMTAKAKV